MAKISKTEYNRLRRKIINGENVTKKQLIQVSKFRGFGTDSRLRKARLYSNISDLLTKTSKDLNNTLKKIRFVKKGGLKGNKVEKVKRINRIFDKAEKVSKDFIKTAKNRRDDNKQPAIFSNFDRMIETGKPTRATLSNKDYDKLSESLFGNNVTIKKKVGDRVVNDFVKGKNYNVNLSSIIRFKDAGPNELSVAQRSVRFAFSFSNVKYEDDKQFLSSVVDAIIKYTEGWGFSGNLDEVEEGYYVGQSATITLNAREIKTGSARRKIKRKLVGSMKVKAIKFRYLSDNFKSNSEKIPKGQNCFKYLIKQLYSKHKKFKTVIKN